MRKDKIKLYLFESFVLVVLFIALFVSTNISRLFLSIIIFLFSIIAGKIFPKKKIISYSSREAAILMIGLGILYVGLFYLFGLFLYHFNKQMITFSFKTIIIIIVSSEKMRFLLLSQDGRIRIKNTSRDYSKALTFIIMVLMDLIIYRGVYNLTELNDFLALLGFITFASISCNLFYNYYSRRFGILGIIFYRLITILYAYIIPIVPNMYIYFRSFLRMLYPFILYLLIDSIFDKDRMKESYKANQQSKIGTITLIIVMTLLTMLISCQFRYGLLVVGSGSMRGSLNKGDAIIYESYHKQAIKKGDIIVFKYKDVKMIHRVVEIKNVNNETHYYTRGDINKENDPEYRRENDIIGVNKLRIHYIGIPTLWLHTLFD